MSSDTISAFALLPVSIDGNLSRKKGFLTLLSRYGVYAAVLLHKADCAGAFQTADQRQEVINLAEDFVTALKKAPSAESHICHNYALMLKQLWDRRNRRTPRSAPYAAETTTTDNILETGMGDPEQHMTQSDDRPNRDHFNNMPHFFGASPVADSELGGVPSIENYLLGSFMPGVTDFQNWPVN